MYSMKPVSWRPLSSRPLGALAVETGSVKDLGSAFPSNSFTKSNWTQAGDNKNTWINTAETLHARPCAVMRYCCWVSSVALSIECYWKTAYIQEGGGQNRTRCGYQMWIVKQESEEESSSVAAQSSTRQVCSTSWHAANSMGRLYRRFSNGTDYYFICLTLFLCFFLTFFNLRHQPCLSLSHAPS